MGLHPLGVLVTTEERYSKLDSRHHHFQKIPDPWHYRCLAVIPAVLSAYNECRVVQGAGDASIHAGECLLVWYSFDAKGIPLQEWGFDPPPMLS